MADGTRDVAATPHLVQLDFCDHRHQHHGEQGADVDQHEHVAQAPSEGERKKHSDREQNVAPDCGFPGLLKLAEHGVQSSVTLRVRCNVVCRALLAFRKAI